VLRELDFATASVPPGTSLLTSTRPVAPWKRPVPPISVPGSPRKTSSEPPSATCETQSGSPVPKT
jgi:hypothetical protein